MHLGWRGEAEGAGDGQQVQPVHVEDAFELMAVVCQQETAVRLPRRLNVQKQLRYIAAVAAGLEQVGALTVSKHVERHQTATVSSRVSPNAGCPRLPRVCWFGVLRNTTVQGRQPAWWEPGHGNELGEWNSQQRHLVQVVVLLHEALQLRLHVGQLGRRKLVLVQRHPRRLDQFQHF